MFDDFSFYKLNWFRDIQAVAIARRMPFGYLLHIPNVHSLIRSEYECDLLLTVSVNTQMPLKNMYCLPFCNILT